LWKAYSAFSGYNILFPVIWCSKSGNSAIAESIYGSLVVLNPWFSLILMTPFNPFPWTLSWISETGKSYVPTARKQTVYMYNSHMVSSQKYLHRESKVSTNITMGYKSFFSVHAYGSSHICVEMLLLSLSLWD
jgi:hypothetical protein